MSADTTTAKRTADIATDPNFSDCSAEFLAMCGRIGGTDLDEMAEVDPENLAEEFIKLPAQIAYWSALTASATQHVLVAERQLKAKLASLWLETRTKLTLDPTKGRATEALVDATMQADPRWSEAHVEVEEARLILAHAKVRMDSLRCKREALSSFNALRRAELQANVYAA